MTDAVSTMRRIAKAIVSSGFIERSSESNVPSPSLNDLRPNLLILMGRGGLRALAARALFLASRSAPALRDVKVDEGGAFVGLDESHAGPSERDLQDARVVLLTEILLLLLQFIGLGMTMAVITDTWPDAELDTGDLSETRPS